MNYQNFDCVILADGDFPTHEVPLSILKDCRYLCCCDHAAVEAMRRGYRVDAIVGDGDSLSDAFKAEHRDILHVVSEQDDNDMTKATRFCVAKGFRRIAYLGATGKREDHTMGNISHLVDFLDVFSVSPTMFTDYGVFVPAQGESSFAVARGQQVSIFNVSCTSLSGSGLRWQPYAFQHFWQGTLNEALDETVVIKGDGKYLVYLVFQ